MVKDKYAAEKKAEWSDGDDSEGGDGGGEQSEKTGARKISVMGKVPAAVHSGANFKSNAHRQHLRRASYDHVSTVMSPTGGVQFQDNSELMKNVLEENKTTKKGKARHKVSSVKQRLSGKRGESVGMVLDPRSSFMQRWDSIITALLVYTALWTPYEVSFLSTKFNFLFVFNMLVNFFFLVDLFVQFFVAYYDEDSVQWVFKLPLIARNYLTGWFTIDLISVIPFDIVTFFVDFGSDMSSLRILRIIRLLRLIKLLRILKASRILARWESEIGFAYSTMSLLKFFFLVVIVSHWNACFLHMVPSFEDSPDNWIVHYGIQDWDPYEKYIVSIYWSIMTVTTIGYGDVVPRTTAEVMLVTIGMLFGGGVYAYVIGAVCGTIAGMDEATTHFHRTMDMLNEFMAEMAVPKFMRRRFRDYFNHCKQMFRNRYYKQILQDMSPGLQGEFAVFLHAGWISKISFFNTIKEESGPFITAVALSLVPKAYPPKEVIVFKGEACERMYVIQRGLVARLGRILGGGKFFGEDMILHHAVRHYSVCAITYVDCYRLTKMALESILNTGEFPHTKKKVRKAAIRLALRREFIKYAAVHRMQEAVKRKTGNGPTRGKLVLVKQMDRAVAKRKKQDKLHAMAGAIDSYQYDNKRNEPTKKPKTFISQLSNARRVSDLQQAFRESNARDASNEAGDRSATVEDSRRKFGNRMPDASNAKVIRLLTQRHRELTELISSLSENTNKRIQNLEDKLQLSETRIKSTTANWTSACSFALIVLVLTGIAVSFAIHKM